MSKKNKKIQLYMDQAQKSKRTMQIIIGLAVICVICIILFALYNHLKPVPYNVSLNSQGDLIIPMEELSYPVSYIQHSALSQDLIVMVYDDGAAKVAFNTCEDCYSSGNAQYSYNNGSLTCANCINSFSADTLGEASWGGCKPVAIPVEFRQDSDSEIIIPASVLDFAAHMFSTWDNGYYNVSFQDYQP